MMRCSKAYRDRSYYLLQSEYRPFQLFVCHFEATSIIRTHYQLCTIFELYGLCQRLTRFYENKQQLFWRIRRLVFYTVLQDVIKESEGQTQIDLRKIRLKQERALKLSHDPIRWIWSNFSSVQFYGYTMHAIAFLEKLSVRKSWNRLFVPHIIETNLDCSNAKILVESGTSRLISLTPIPCNHEKERSWISPSRCETNTPNN